MSDGGGQDRGEAAAPPGGDGLRRYRVAVVLVVLAVALGVAAGVVLPSSSAVSVHGAVLRVAVKGPLAVSAVDLQETPMPGGSGVTLAVSLRSPQAQEPTPAERLSIAVPDPSRPGLACPATALACTGPTDGALTVIARFPDHVWYRTAGTEAAAPYTFVLPMRIDLPGVRPNLVQDDLDVAAALPQVSATQQTAWSNAAPVYLSSVVVTYRQAMANAGAYTWSDTAAAPLSIGNSVNWSYLAVTDAPAALSPQLDSGVDLTVQGQNTTAVFLAGALLGIAGGALVAAITEAVRA